MQLNKCTSCNVSWQNRIDSNTPEKVHENVSAFVYMYTYTHAHDIYGTLITETLSILVRFSNSKPLNPIPTLKPETPKLFNLNPTHLGFWASACGVRKSWVVLGCGGTFYHNRIQSTSGWWYYVFLRWNPHPGIVTTRDNGDYIRVLWYS